MFASELELFSIAIINLPLKFLEIMVVSTLQTKKNTATIDAKAQPSCDFKTSAKTTLNNKHEVNLENKVSPKTYYHHTLGQVQIDETLTKN